MYEGRKRGVPPPIAAIYSRIQREGGCIREYVYSVIDRAGGGGQFLIFDRQHDGCRGVRRRRKRGNLIETRLGKKERTIMISLSPSFPFFHAQGKKRRRVMDKIEIKIA